LFGLKKRSTGQNYLAGREKSTGENTELNGDLHLKRIADFADWSGFRGSSSLKLINNAGFFHWINN